MLQFFYADNSSALRVSAAAEKRPFFALPDYQLALFTLITFYSRRLWRRFRRQDVTLLIQIENRFAFRIAAAPQKWAESAAFLYHRLAALGAFMLAYFFLDHFTFFVAGISKIAIRIARATQEPAALANPVNKLLAALRTFIFTPVSRFCLNGP